MEAQSSLEEPFFTPEKMVSCMATAVNYAGIKATKKNVAIVLRLFQELMERGGDITLTEIDEIVEQVDNELKEVTVAKRNKSKMADGKKVGDKNTTWIEDNIETIIRKMPQRKHTPRKKNFSQK